jgi:hypothetical protein
MTSKRLISYSLLILIIAGLAAIITSFFDQLGCEGQPINNNVTPTQAQQIWGEHTVNQSFIAPRNGLKQIDLQFQTYQRANTHDVTLRLRQVINNSNNQFDGVEVFRVDFNATTVIDQTWHSFSFPPLADSAGKTYLITLESPESTDGNALTVGGIERDLYLPGLAFLGSIPVRADIAFRACFELTPLEKLQFLGERLTRQRPALWGYQSFFGATLFLYVLLLGVFLRKLIRLFIKGLL